jgi:DNA polymerase III subunit gamma/tau
VLLRFMAFPASGPDGGGSGGTAPPAGARGVSNAATSVAQAARSSSAPAGAPTSAPVAMARPTAPVPAPMAAAPIVAPVPATVSTAAAAPMAAPAPATTTVATASPPWDEPADDTPRAHARPAPATPATPAAAPQAQAAPLLRPTAPRAVAAATATAGADSDDPPWGDEEPDIIEDDLPAPTRTRLNGNPGVNANSPGNGSTQGRGGVSPQEAAAARRARLAVVHDDRDDEPDDIAAPAAPRAIQQTVAMPPELPQFERTELGTRWYALINQISAAGGLVAMVRALAIQSELLACGTDADGKPQWRLSVALETLRNPALGEKLAVLLRAQLGHELSLVVEMGEPQDTPLKRDTAETDRRQREAIDTIHADPTVRALLAQFQTARILPGSIKPL